MSNIENSPKDPQHKDAAVKPDPETLHKTDPQDNMKGPISSIMNNISDEAQKKDGETKDDADAKRDSHM